MKTVFTVCAGLQPGQTGPQAGATPEPAGLLAGPSLEHGREHGDGDAVTAARWREWERERKRKREDVQAGE